MNGLALLWVYLGELVYSKIMGRWFGLPKGYMANSVRRLVPGINVRSYDIFLVPQNHPEWFKLKNNELAFVLECWYHGA